MRQISKYSTRKRLQKKIQKQVPPGVAWEARVGSGSGIAIVPGYKELRYVRPINNELPVIVHRGAAMDTEGVRVWIGKQHRREHLRILEASGVNNGPGTDSVPAHDHGPTSKNPVYIADWQILPLCIYATTGMNVHVNSGRLVYQGKPFEVSADDIDLTESIPVAGAQYSLIRSNTVGVLSVQDGDPVDSLADLTDDDIPQCDAGYAALAYVRLYEGQTSLSKVTINPDVRTVVWGGGLFDSGVAMLDEGAVGFGDGSNLLDGDADNFYYDAVHKVLIVGGNAVPSTAVPRIVVVGDGSSAGLSVISYGGWPIFSAWRANGTEDAPTAVVLNDVLIAMSSVGYAAGAWQDARCYLKLIASEDWTGTARGAYWQFQSTPVGEATTVNALTIGGRRIIAEVPIVMYTDTKAAIVALTGALEGTTAYATDTDEFGTYNGSTWDWNSSGAYVALTPTTDARNVIQPSAATVKALVIKGFVAQSDNLLEMQTSAEVAASYFGPTGDLYTDHISEVTGAHGVIVDGWTIQDGGAARLLGGTEVFDIIAGDTTLGFDQGANAYFGARCEVFFGEDTNFNILEDCVVDINGNLTIEYAIAGSRINQDLTTDASPIFNNVYISAANARGLGFWEQLPINYGMFMHDGSVYDYGDVTDYKIVFAMTGGAARGFVWTYDTTPAMALNAYNGNLALKGSITSLGSGDNTFVGFVGIGIADPAYHLSVMDATNTKPWQIRFGLQEGVYDYGMGRSPSDGFCNVIGTQAGNSGYHFMVTKADTNVIIPLHILNNGYVGVGITPVYQLQVGNDSAGKPGAGGLWTVVSDERLKENIILADLDRCYEIVKHLPLKRFTFKKECYTEKQVRDRSALGWLAKDVKPIFPKAVGSIDFELPSPEDAPEDFKPEVIKDCLDLNSGQIEAAMYGAIQKLIQKVEKLEQGMIQ